MLLLQVAIIVLTLLFMAAVTVAVVLTGDVRQLRADLRSECRHHNRLKTRLAGGQPRPDPGTAQAGWDRPHHARTWAPPGLAARTARTADTTTILAAVNGRRAS
jgi:hypothetical protein